MSSTESHIAPAPRRGPVTFDQVPSGRSHSGAGSAHTGFCGEGFFFFSGCVGLIAGRQAASFFWQQLWFLVLICEIVARSCPLICDNFCPKIPSFITSAELRLPWNLKTFPKPIVIMV